jgi:hypothetical protein
MPSRSAVVDGAVVGGGAALLVAGFLPWWGVGIVPSGVAVASVGGRTAWDTSPAWWLPVLAGTVVGGLWLLRRLGRLSLGWLPAAAALVGVVGFGLVVGRWLTLPSGGSGDFAWFASAPATDVEQVLPARGTPGIGLWLAGLALAAQAVAATVALRRRDAGA